MPGSLRLSQWTRATWALDSAMTAPKDDDFNTIGRAPPAGPRPKAPNRFTVHVPGLGPEYVKSFEPPVLYADGGRPKFSPCTVCYHNPVGPLAVEALRLFGEGSPLDVVVKHLDEVGEVVELWRMPRARITHVEFDPHSYGMRAHGNAVENARVLLQLLDERGGLGLDWHERIRSWLRLNPSEPWPAGERPAHPGTVSFRLGLSIARLEVTAGDRDVVLSSEEA
jgi:hypothetical protein